MSLSKNHAKLITSLQQKKYRLKHKLFIAEGIKVVQELLESNLEVEHIFCTDETMRFEKGKVTIIKEPELKKISNLKTPNKVLAVFNIPKETPFDQGRKNVIIALDGINDPGNLGTIIRLCDWFGVEQLVCSNTTVDCYNQKVVQSTMGSITRINIIYTDLSKYLAETELPIYVADMVGENVYKTSLPNNGILVMGNEANGISSEIKELVNHRLTIPRFGHTQKTESLNVATATAILLSEFKRRLE